MPRQFTIFCLLVVFVYGCAATRTAIEYSELDIKSTTQRPVFLRHDSSKIFLATDCPVSEWEEIQKKIAASFEARGYEVVAEKEHADILLQVMVRNRGTDKHSARKVQGQDFTAGTSAVVGAGTGYLSSGGGTGTAVGSLAGLAAGGIADVTINSWVHVGVLEIDAPVLVMERIPGSPSNFAETTTTIVVKAKQSGLDWSKVAEPVEGALVREISLLFPERQ